MNDKMKMQMECAKALSEGKSVEAKDFNGENWCECYTVVVGSGIDYRVKQDLYDVGSLWEDELGDQWMLVGLRNTHVGLIGLTGRYRGNFWSMPVEVRLPASEDQLFAADVFGNITKSGYFKTMRKSS